MIIGLLIVIMVLSITIITASSIGIETYNLDNPVMKQYSKDNSRKKLILEFDVAIGVLVLIGSIGGLIMKRNEIFKG